MKPVRIWRVLIGLGHPRLRLDFIAFTTERLYLRLALLRPGRD